MIFFILGELSTTSLQIMVNGTHDVGIASSNSIIQATGTTLKSKRPEKSSRFGQIVFHSKRSYVHRPVQVFGDRK